jgi:hypothetical protein
MSAEGDLARAIASALLDYADRKDGVGSEVTAPDEDLPRVSATATSQRAVLAALATATHKGLTTREIANRAGVTQLNVYEKLDRLRTMGYVEPIPGSPPKRWQLTPRAQRLAASGGITQLRVASSVSSTTVNEIKEAIAWCTDTAGERSPFTTAMERRGNRLAGWAKEDYPGLKTWSGTQPPPKPKIAAYLRQALVAIQDGKGSGARQPDQSEEVNYVRPESAAPHAALVVMGTASAGKSDLLRTAIDRIMESGAVVILDPNGDYLRAAADADDAPGRAVELATQSAGAGSG